MELNDIRIFIELYHNKSISRTAEKLSYTQSNISTRLMKLEKEFNTVFFVRSKTGLEILPAAERFMKYATKINLISNELYNEFNTHNYEKNIASTQLLSRLYFPVLYQKSNTFHLHTSTINKMARGLENNIYHIIVTHSKIDFKRKVFCSKKIELLYWAQSVKTKNKTGENPSIIVSRDRSCPLRIKSLQILDSIHSDMPVIEVDTLELMISLLHSINSIALLPKKIIDSDDSLVEYKELNPTSLDIFFYCSNKDDLMLIKDLY